MMLLYRVLLVALDFSVLGLQVGRDWWIRGTQAVNRLSYWQEQQIYLIAKTCHYAGPFPAPGGAPLAALPCPPPDRDSSGGRTLGGCQAQGDERSQGAGAVLCSAVQCSEVQYCALCRAV